MISAERRSNHLILGMGNPILSDDAVGVMLAADLNRLLGSKGDVDIIEECSVGGLNLLDYLTGYSRVVVLDAIHTKGGEPGDLYYFRATELRHTAHLSNVHDANFATSLTLGRKLGHRLPRDQDIHVFAIEVMDDRTFGTELTPALARAYPQCLHQVYEGVRGIIDGWPDSQEPKFKAEENHGENHCIERPAVSSYSPSGPGR